jgi:uncharacterized protein YjcR
MAEQRDTVTPNQMAAQLGVSAKTIRAWLREQGWQHVHQARWHLTPDQAGQVRERFS